MDIPKIKFLIATEGVTTGTLGGRDDGYPTVDYSHFTSIEDFSEHVNIDHLPKNTRIFSCVEITDDNDALTALKHLYRKTKRKLQAKADKERLKELEEEAARLAAKIAHHKRNLNL